MSTKFDKYDKPDPDTARRGKGDKPMRITGFSSHMGSKTIAESAISRTSAGLFMSIVAMANIYVHMGADALSADAINHTIGATLGEDAFGLKDPKVTLKDLTKHGGYIENILTQSVTVIMSMLEDKSVNFIMTEIADIIGTRAQGMKFDHKNFVKTISDQSSQIIDSREAIMMEEVTGTLLTDMLAKFAEEAGIKIDPEEISGRLEEGVPEFINSVANSVVVVRRVLEEKLRDAGGDFNKIDFSVAPSDLPNIISLAFPERFPDGNGVVFTPKDGLGFDDSDPSIRSFVEGEDGSLSRKVSIPIDIVGMTLAVLESLIMNTRKLRDMSGK